jgi:hypothetical protein
MLDGVVLKKELRPGNYVIMCNECDHDLEAYFLLGTFYVKPCKTCTESAFQEGWGEARGERND